MPVAFPDVAAEFGKKLRLFFFAQVRGLKVNVQAVHVAFLLVKPAGGAVDHSVRVQGLEAAVGVVRPELAPALVENRPQADAWVAGQQAGGFLHRGKEIPPGLRVRVGPQVPALLQMQGGQNGIQEIAVFPVVDHVLKDDHPQPVAVVIELLRLDFDVLAQGVEAQGFHRQDVFFIGLRAGGGVQAVAPVALVQKAAKKIGLAVQAQAGDAADFPDGDRPQGEVGAHPVFAAGQRKIVKIGVLRGPRMGFGQGDPGFSVPDRPGPPVQLDLAIHDPFGLHLCPVGTGPDMQGADISLRHRLQPDGLPDSRAGGVPHAAPLTALLSPGVARVQIVDHPDGQLVFSGPQYVRDLHGEGQIAVFVPAQLLLVDRDRRAPHDCPKVQQNPLSCPLMGEGKAAAVQYLFPGHWRFVHVGQQAFRAEGHEDLPAPAVTEQVPAPVQAEPFLPLHLRAGIPVPGNFRQVPPFGGDQSLYHRRDILIYR